MTRVLATIVWPFATLDRYLTDRRVQAAQQQHAADMARIASCGNGTCCRPSHHDDDTDHDWCD